MPKTLFTWYHSLCTGFVAWKYRYPSRKLIVIAVTGTNGKSTTCALIADLLAAAGKKVGLASSVSFRVGDREWNNDLKMTMLGRGALQSLLFQMVKEGCMYAVIEASSEGLAQGRLAGLDVDVAVFTNLTPEHIESHGSFEKYKKAKERLFVSLKRSYKKTIGGKRIPKIIVVNTDDSHALSFTHFWADQKIGFGAHSLSNGDLDQWYAVSNIKTGHNGTDFILDHICVQTKLEGVFNAYNAACAYTTLVSLGFSVESLNTALLQSKGVSGRMQWVDAGQGYRVLVDYAPEPASLRALYEYIGNEYGGNSNARIIHVLGSAGGGRDIARRPILGDIAGRNADIVIVTNEDPYDEDPNAIIRQVADGAKGSGKIVNENLFMIQDRKKAIFKACSMAQTGDLVVLTGKGAEHAIMGPQGISLPWNEVDVAREAIVHTRKAL